MSFSEVAHFSVLSDGNYCYAVSQFNPLNPELIPICYLLALLGAHHFLHVSRIRVKDIFILIFHNVMKSKLLALDSSVINSMSVILLFIIIVVIIMFMKD